MECFYINLDSANERRINVEGNFSQNKIAGWSFSRYSAIDSSYIENNRVIGSLHPHAKACFLSHKHLIGSNLHKENPIFILEDDAIFGKKTCDIVNRVPINSNDLEWDILFTDICVPQIATMFELIRLRRQLTIANEIKLLNLAMIPHAGSTAYILNPKSMSKIFNLLDAEKALNTPYDLYLRKLIHESKIKGYVFFPFITSLSEFSETSQIQQIESQATDLIWNLFRKMIWLERDFDQLKHILKQISQKLCDEETKMFGILFSAMVSEAYKPK